MNPFIDLKNKAQRVVLLLQGGGALGSYQVGAYETLHKALVEAGRSGVDWVGGISIGAVNSSIIASPKHQDDPVGELKSFWKEIVSPPYVPFDFTTASGWFPAVASWQRQLIPKWLNFAGLACGPFGLPKFFVPSWTNPWLRTENLDQLGFYDTHPLARTLNEHVDWDHINDDEHAGRRLLLGVTSLKSGELQFLDSFLMPANGKSFGKGKFIPVKMSANCVRASGALPPAFPPVRLQEEIRQDADSEKLKDDAYLDGGVSSNTLITELQDEFASSDTIVFLLDLWDRKGDIPKSMDEIVWRQKCIQFGSRREAVEHVVERHQLKAEQAVVKSQAAEPPTKLEICQLMYESPGGPQFAFSDADFSPETYEKMYRQGKRDMQRMLTDPYQVNVFGPKSIFEPDCFAALYRIGSQDKHLATDTASRPASEVAEHALARTE